MYFNHIYFISPISQITSYNLCPLCCLSGSINATHILLDVWTSSKTWLTFQLLHQKQLTSTPNIYLLPVVLGYGWDFIPNCSLSMLEFCPACCPVVLMCSCSPVVGKHCFPWSYLPPLALRIFVPLPPQ